MKSRIPTAVVLFAVLAVLLAGSAQAASTTYTDPAGDSFDGRASMDIVAVRYDVRQVDKGGPLSLVVEMELAAPPEGALASYVTDARSDDCGAVRTSYGTGTAAINVGGSGPRGYFYLGCTDTSVRAEIGIDGNTVQVSIPMDGLPKQMREGSTFRGLKASALLTQANWTGAGHPVDKASTARSWSY